MKKPCHHPHYWCWGVFPWETWVRETCFMTLSHPISELSIGHPWILDDSSISLAYNTIYHYWHTAFPEHIYRLSQPVQLHLFITLGQLPKKFHASSWSTARLGSCPRTKNHYYIPNCVSKKVRQQLLSNHHSQGHLLTVAGDARHAHSCCRRHRPPSARFLLMCLWGKKTWKEEKNNIAHE